MEEYSSWARSFLCIVDCGRLLVVCGPRGETSVQAPPTTRIVEVEASDAWTAAEEARSSVCGW